ncbi:hypothetical protein A0J48_018915 [Sphaerospermopsis aphanizomenoides BCCUSP55]|uniref:hypothetical protein n=1 Tax=Sphaerospermopsis aphanizomenoides TaxID=459663 RepID=UPI001904B890|nr:hypothetical protein [Sphaerospermopsis aphanizomenoides]MBK1989580.1 hypothetical protein [Sphaerospermopsis aphanizomenoides BCCUSP55]
MNQTPENSQEPNILGKFASVVGLLSIGLFFAGWIDRWSYFSFFQLELTTLDFPTESFLFVPLQIFLGNSRSILLTILTLILTILAIQLTLWLIRVASEVVIKRYVRSFLEKIIQHNQRKKLWINKQIKSFATFILVQVNAQYSQRFVRSLINELLIVAWILIVIFWMAKWQGFIDARRDAGVNSTLPVVTIIAPDDKFALGRQLDDEFIDPSLKGYRFIGDKGLFEDIQGKEDTDISNDKKPRVWRLLLERNGWIYVFTNLPDNAQLNQRPLVLAVQITDKGNLIIRSPEVSRPKSP